MIVSVPACAPATPPLTGASRHATPRVAQRRRHLRRRPRARSSRGRRRRAIASPPRSSPATARTTSGVGRLTSTVAAASATAAGDSHASAPRATCGAIASARVSKTASVVSGVDQPRGHVGAHGAQADEADGDQPTRRCRPARTGSSPRSSAALAIIGVLTTAVLPAGGAHAPLRRQPYASTSCPLAGASRPASHGVLWPTALLSAHMRCCVRSVARSSPPTPRAVAAGSGGFSAWRRSGS